MRSDWYHAERLHRAAADGDISRVESLIAEGIALNEFDDIGRTPLHYAAKNEHLEVAALLLDAGADINARDEETNSDTVVSMAASYASAEMVLLLLRRGADPSITGWMGLDAFDVANQRRDEAGQAVRHAVASYASRN